MADVPSTEHARPAIRFRPWVRRLGAAALGAVAMLALGQLFSYAGGSCAILCRPPIAAVYGAVMGLLLSAPSKRA